MNHEYQNNEIQDVTKIKIESLLEFVERLDDFPVEEYYFRGESKFYSQRKASAYRDYTPAGEPVGFSDYYINPERLLSDYYYNIGSQLSEVSKENFLAYAQHHGIYTRLLDITTNILTALYFATRERSGDEDGDNYGYIYLYPRSSCINVSEYLRGPNPPSLMKVMANQDIRLMVTLANGLARVVEDNPDKILQCFSSLCEHIIQVSKQSLDDSYPFDIEIINEVLSTESMIDYTRFPILGVMVFKELIEKSHHSSKFDNMKYQLIKEYYDGGYLYGDAERIFYYLYVYSMHLKFLMSDNIFAWDFHDLPKFPFLIYEPTESFDRMKAQDGLFFYQLGIHKTEDTYHSGSMEYQQLIPSHIIEIKNKKKIREFTEKVGVTRHKLFPDPDNIAHWVNQRTIQKL